jgi:hypothetical protein
MGFDPNAQEADAKDKAKTHGDGARRAVRSAWSHIFYPVKSETAGKPFDLEHTLISSRDLGAAEAASLLWLGRNRHGPPNEVVRCHLQRGRHGAAADERREGEAHPGD